MIEIDDKIVSADLLRECFACDIAQCKGICCVEGNAGAPLEAEEVGILEREYANYKPYMTPEGIEAVERQGFMVVDEDGDLTTPLVGDAECAYTYTEERHHALRHRKGVAGGQDRLPQTDLVPPLSDPRRALLERHGRAQLPPLVGLRTGTPMRQNGSGSRSTRRFGSRSSVVSAKSSTRRSKLPNNCSRINRETTTRNEKPTYHRCRLAAAHHDGSGTGPPYGDDPRHR